MSFMNQHPDELLHGLFLRINGASASSDFCQQKQDTNFMGQTLSEPVVEKHTTSGSDLRITWAASEMQGWRISMIFSYKELDSNP